MAFNLLCEPWLPLAVPGETPVWVTPAEAVLAPPQARLAWPRADFCCAAHEFLIGLLSLAFAPKTASAWRGLYEKRPAPAEVEAAFAPFLSAFDLDGPGLRFLQDVSATEDGRVAPVAALLIDAPGENALKRNLDFFVKRAAVEALCPRCAAMALYTLQTYAPSGGQGHRTGLRGGGPLTTLAVVEGDLWRTLWANVMPWDALARKPIVAADPTRPEPVFPWMGRAVASHGKDAETRPGDAAWLQTFFGQPRRIWLEFEGEGTCGVCGEAAAAVARTWHTRPRGVNYKGGWVHSLSPWRMDAGKVETLTAIHGSPNGPDWRDWLGLVESLPDDAPVPKFPRGPAPAIAALRARFAGDRSFELRLWAFGYDTDNMKARGWNDAEMPLLPIPASAGAHANLYRRISELVSGADVAAGQLAYALKRAHSRRPGDVKSDFSAAVANFLGLARSEFEARLRELTERALEGGEGLDLTATRALREDWAKTLSRAAYAAYDEAVAAMPVETYDQREGLQPPLNDRRGPVTGRLILASAFEGEKSKVRAALNLPAKLRRKVEMGGKGA